MTSQEVNKAIHSISKSYGFLRKRNAFFRVHGDGILQTIKWQYEPHAGSHTLYFGLLSMYGEILPQWLTSWGCIPKYEAMRLVDKDYFQIKMDYGNWIVTPMNGRAAGMGSIDIEIMKSVQFQDEFRKAREELNDRIKPEEQLKKLEGIVLPKLNQIDTQAKMYDTICFYSKILNDSYKIAPLLACCRYEEALMVVRAILQQNRNAFISNGMVESEWMKDQYYSKMLAFEALILQGPEAVQARLKDNFATNYAMFFDAFPPKKSKSSLQAENQTLKFAASQANQNAYLTATMDANNAELIRRLGPTPIPSYQVPAPYPYCGNGYSNNNCGCGCGCG